MIEFEKDPIQNQTAEKLRHLGVEAVVFDLDDTLIYTGEIFTRFINEYVEFVSTASGIKHDILLKRLQELNDEEYLKMGVSPTRWATVIDRLSQEHNNNEIITTNIDILMKIYTTKPRVRPGAKAILKGLKDTGFKIGMVTHAGTDWTERKLTQTGLLDYFDAIEVVDPNGFKTIDHWQKGMDLLGVESKHCLVVGDNLKGDIIPSFTLGAKVIWMPSPWSVYREGVVPEGIVQMNELHGFWDAVQKLE